jgi:RNA polymerase sigma factor (sigma-70 family)
VQTTFLNAQSGLRRGVVPQFELAWLFKIAQNVCRTRRDSAWRRGRVESVRDLDALQDVLATPERGGGVSVHELTRALAAIPERQRRALLLREWRGLSYDEIAGELGLSVSAVETLLFRARRSLAEQLEQGGTKQRRGTAASIAALVRWLFQGSAAPLKIAAATAVVATTATVFSVPLARDHGRAPAQIAPQVDGFRADARGKERAQRAAHGGARPAPSQPPVVAADPGASSPDSPPASSPLSARGSDPSAGGKGTDALSPDPAVTPPKVTVPTATVPSVTVPTVTVPTVTVPPVPLPAAPALPAVELPLEASALDVPSLETPKLP